MNLLVLKTLKKIFGHHLFESFPDLERREQIVIGGTFRDKVQVGSISTYFQVYLRKAG